MKSQSHRIILASVCLLVGVIAIVLALILPPKEEIVGPVPSDSQGKRVAPFKDDEIEKVKAGWSHQSKWEDAENKHRIFLPKKMLYFPDEKSLKAYDPNVRIGPFPIWWLEKYDFSLSDLSVAVQDPDGDGFTNVMEYSDDSTKATDPMDPNSHPDYITRLRLKEVQLRKFEMKFTSMQELDGKPIFSVILTTETDRKSKMLKKGDRLEGYEILDFVTKKEIRKNEATQVEGEVDVSELQIENASMEVKAALPLNQVVSIPEVTATLVLVLPNEVDRAFKVTRGGQFDIRGKKYRLLDAKQGSAKIRDVETKAEIAISSITSEDFSQLPPKQLPPKTK